MYVCMYVYIYIYIYMLYFLFLDRAATLLGGSITPNPPTNIVPTNMARLKLSGKLPMDMIIPPL